MRRDVAVLPPARAGAPGDDFPIEDHRVTGRIFSTPRKQALSGLNPECTTAIVTPRRNLVCTADLMTPAYILISVSQRL